MPTSRAQLRLAHAVEEGRSKKMPESVADEMIRAFHGHRMHELPDHADGDDPPARKPKLGSGGRFQALKKKLGERKGVKNPGALAAYIGRKKYGAKRFGKLAAHGRRVSRH